MKTTRILFSIFSFWLFTSLSAKNWTDVNGDEAVDISDVVAVINTMSGDRSFLDTADVNCDGNVDISDVVAVINAMAGIVGDKDPAVTAGLCPNTHHPHFINMGDGRKWACCNVNASAPWEFGGYYAWGETEERSGNYDWTTYQLCDGNAESCYFLGRDISGTSHDVAFVKWGNRWCMPRLRDFEYLGHNSTIVVATINGVKGRRITAKNGSSIFLPSAGEKYEYGLSSEGDDGSYWTSTLCDTVMGNAYEIYFEYETPIKWINDYDRCYGQSVRPVAYEKPDEAVKAGLCPDNHHPHAIDLGLGVNFSCCNVGADAPWETGGYYAWGETIEKTSYVLDNYLLYNSSQGLFFVPRIGVTGNIYDVSYATWGGNWYMPNETELSKLTKSCTSEWTVLNGVSGRKFTAMNGSSVFLPVTGYRSGESTEGSNSGYYWSTTVAPGRVAIDSKALILSESNVSVRGMTRYDGLCARPVCAAPDEAVRAFFCPDNHHPHAIDLGNGYEMACCNVDASAPWEDGGFYAWGETVLQEKDEYNWETYQYSDSDGNITKDIGNDIAGTEYDVAHVKWGGSWVMPNRQLISYIYEHLSYDEYRLIDVEGAVVFTKFGQKIFLPLAGSPGDNPELGRYRGNYWTSTGASGNNAYCFETDGRYLSEPSPDDRCFGMSVRPVRIKTK